MNNVPNFFAGKQAGVGDWLSGIGRGAADRAAGIGRGMSNAFKLVTGTGTKPVQLPAPVQQTLSSAAENQSAQTVLNWFLGAAGVGGGIAGLSALLRRLKKPSKEKELEEVHKRTGPILQLKKAQTSPTDVTWRNPAIFAGTVGGSILGYMLLKKLLDAKESQELKDKRVRAEQSYTKAISSALKPTGLKLTSKRGSIQGMQDEEVLMAALDEIATEKIATMQKQGFFDELTQFAKKLGWWSLLGAVPIAGLSAAAGWNMGAAGNPHTKEIGDIERRELLQSVNAPSSPILTILESRKKRRKKKDEEEEGGVTINEQTSA